ncbi:MAG: alpha/beta hydrolase [Planctomycetaceae bacterium]|nr:alpha/beta hydrolase [Planctomycetaceae bacterium]
MMTRRFAILCLLAIFVGSLSSTLATAKDSDATTALKAELAKRFGDRVEVRLDVPYAGNENPKQQLDLYLPKERGGKPLPVIVFIHGGGWSGGDRKGYALGAAQMAASGEYVGVSVGYRLSAEVKWPAQIHDCKAAIRWIRAHAKELNLDTDHIGCTGGSAGGHLVTLLGLTSASKALEGEVGEHTGESSRVTCVINFCGPSDLTVPLMQGEAAKKDDPAVAGLIGGGIEAKRDVAQAASPLTYVTAQAVPIMTVHGTKDLRVNYEQGVNLDAALKKAGAKSYLVPVVNAGHGIPISLVLQNRMKQFWDLYLRGVTAEISTAPIEVPVQPAKK